MRYFTTLLLSALIGTQSLFCCTDFVVTAQDGTIVNGRSLEFAIDLESRITTHPKSESMQSLAPNNEKGLSWTSKWGFLDIASLQRPCAFQT